MKIKKKGSKNTILQVIKCQPTYSAILKLQDSGILPYCPTHDYFSEMIILYCLLIVKFYFLKAKSALKLCEINFHNTLN